jgi:hypothetical protein
LVQYMTRKAVWDGQTALPQVLGSLAPSEKVGHELPSRRCIAWILQWKPRCGKRR